MVVSAAELNAGTVLVWGNYNSNGEGNVPADLTNAVAIAAGYSHNLALRSDGTVAAWGLNGNGQANVPVGLSNVVQIAAGWYFSLAVKSDGNVIGWGAAPAGLETLSNVVAVAGGGAHMLALKEDGTVSALGDNNYFQCAVPPGLSNVVAIAAGMHFSCALKSDGTSLAWGSDGGDSQLSVGSTRGVNIVANRNHGIILTADGNVLTWGDTDTARLLNYSTFPPVWYPYAGDGAAAAIGVGPLTFYASSASGSPISWGYNVYGQLNIPPGASNVVAIDAGLYHTIALIGDGKPELARRHLGLSMLPPDNVASSETVTLHVAAVGAAPLSYHWLWNGSNFATTLSPKLELTNVQPAQAGTYSVVVSNSLGWFQGAERVLSVQPLKITGQPVSQNVYEAADVAFEVSAVGTALNYQWLFNGAELSGQTNAVLSLPAVATNQAGTYSVLVSNLYGALWSSNATLTVALPTITTHPTNRVCNAGTSTSFTVGTTGANLAYQWLSNGAGLSGATNVTLTITSVTASNAGTYQVLVSNAHRVLQSSNAELQVVALTLVSPTNRFVFSGGSTTFNPGVQGVGPFGYQWLYQGQPLLDATNGSLTLSNLATADSGNYSVLVTNSFGAVTSAVAVLTVVDSTPMVTVQPASRGAYPGGSAVFQVAADGSKPLFYQWHHDGVVVPAATNSSLLLLNLSSNQLGEYTVVVSNAFGTTPSSNASLVFLSVVTWGSTNNYGLGSVPLTLTNAVAIAGGTGHSLALKSDGRVVAWGYNYSGQTNVPTSATNVTAIAAAGGHSLALRSDGRVIAWGTIGNAPLEATNVVAIAAGANHNLALKADGRVLAWGQNYSGQTNVPATLSNVVAIAGGGSFSAALKSDGNVVIWGSGGSTAGMSNIIAIAAGEFPLVALRANGTVIASGSTVPASLTNVVAVAAGRYHALALRENGTVTNLLSTTPATPPSLTNVAMIASGENHCLAILGSIPPRQIQLERPIVESGGAHLALPTQCGRVYALEYKDSLADLVWRSLLLAPGNGQSISVVDSSATNSQRFYRVRRW